MRDIKPSRCVILLSLGLRQMTPASGVMILNVTLKFHAYDSRVIWRNVEVSKLCKSYAKEILIIPDGNLSMVKYKNSY